MTGQPARPVKSAGRALDVIDHVSLVGSASFSEIVEALDLPRSSAHGLLHTLVSSGWLVQSADSRRYALGLRAWQVGRRYDGHDLLTEKATPVMRELTAETGETVQLARLDGVENVYIAISPSPNPMRLVSTVGMRLHAHATGIGKALLSALDPEEARHRLSGAELPRLTHNTVVDVDRLVELLERTRATGFAVDDGEFVDECRCVAVPVTTEADTGFPSAMSVTMPTSRTSSEWPHYLRAPLVRAAGEVRAAMGLSPL